MVSDYTVFKGKAQKCCRARAFASSLARAVAKLRASWYWTAV